MHVKKAGHLKLLLAQTSCCSYSTGRGRETQDLTVPLRKAFSGHIKDKLFHHSSEAGKGDSANQLSTPRRPPVPFPPYIEPSRHCKVSVLRLFSAPFSCPSSVQSPTLPPHPEQKQGTGFSCFTRKAQITHISIERDRYEYISLCCLGQEMKCCLFNWQKHTVRAYL